MDDTNIFNIIIDTMISAQHSGTVDKKQYVMNMIKFNLSGETYDRYEPYISITIDGLKAISKTKILEKLKSNKCCIN